MNRIHVCKSGPVARAAIGILLVFGLSATAVGQNVIQGGGLDSESAWTVYDMGSTDPSEVEFNYTDDRPAAGSGGCLHLFGTSAYTNILIWQQVVLIGGVTYELNGAFKELTGDATGGNWVQLYLSQEEPVEGTDYKPPGGANQERLLGFNSWVDGTWSGLDGTFEDDGLLKDDGMKTQFYTAPGNPDEEVIAFFGIKAGVWGNSALTYDVLIDDITLSPVGNLPNRIVDSGFEDGTAFLGTGAAGWNGWIDEAFLDELYPRSGSYSGGLIADPADWATGFGQYVTGLKPGTPYIVTAFGRLSDYDPTDPNQWGLYIGVQDFGRPKVQTQVFSPDYTPVILTFVMGDTNTQADVWAWKGPGAEATVDDYGLWDFHNFLKNADFEKGSLWSWNAMTDPASVDNTQMAGGSWCGALPDGKAGFGQTAGPLEPNTTYGLRVTAKTENTGDIARVGVMDFGGDPVEAEVSGKDYKETTLSFTTGPEATSALVYFSKNEGGKAYSDNFLLCVMQPSEGGTAVHERESADLPVAFGMDPNYPNPFNPETRIRIRLAEAARIEIAVYDVMGRLLKTLSGGAKAAGVHEVRWDGKDASGIDVPSGVYVVRMQASAANRTFDQARKVTLMR
jgi:hypothetical protein